MVLSFRLQIQASEHIHHPIYLTFSLHQLGKVALEIYISLKVALNFNPFGFGLKPQARANVPIPTRQKRQLPLLQLRIALNPLVEVCEYFLDGCFAIDLLLSNASKLCAKGRQLGVQSWSYVLMELPKYFHVVCVQQHHWKFDYFGARLNLFVFQAGSLEVQHQQVSYLGFNVLWWKVKHDRVYFCFRIYCSVLLVELKADTTDIQNIIDTTVVPPLVRNPKCLEHGHHSSRALGSDNFGKIFFDIDVVSEGVRNVKALMLSFYAQTGPKVPISTGNNSVVAFFQVSERGKPSGEQLKNLLDSKPFVNHILCDASQLSAERGQFWIDGRPYVMVKDIQPFAVFEVHNNHRKLDYLRAWFYLFILHARSFEVQDEQVLELWHRQVGFHLSEQRISLLRSYKLKLISMISQCFILMPQLLFEQYLY